MTTVFLRVGVLVVVVASVVSGIARSQPENLRFVVRRSPFVPPQSADTAPSIRRINPQDPPKGSLSQANIIVPVSMPSLPAPPLAPVEPRQPRVADLKRRGVLTVLMYHSPATYFLQRGAQRGLEYELAQAFADQLGVELEIRTPPPGTSLLTWFHEGKGDLVAGVETMAGMDLGPVEVSRPYLEVAAEVITKSDKSAPRHLNELAGKLVMVQPGSVYDQQLQMQTHALSLPPILPLAPGSEAVGEALAAVAHGRAAATVMMAPLSALARTLYPGQLRIAWSLPQPIRLVWAVREGHAELLDAVNTYLEQVGRSGLKKMLLDRYFVDPAHLRNSTYVGEGTLAATRRISRYDRLIAQQAEEAGFDWRVVAALIFEESRFDHDRVSVAGAYGLMQLMPFTARLVGAKNYQEPRDNIEAGVKYLSSLWRTFPYGRPEDRLALTLASYVVGPGHVEDAQRLARALGYDPHCWTDSMELVLPLLENPKYHRKSLFGYAQGREAVRYANAVLKRAAIYSQYVDRILPPVKIRPTPEPQAASAAG
ncbi:MAG: transporter substrate-binding domain-containing protein [Deltaproteobacteria bacterium]|nr:transporter substrate-binding domain-containing protein [Deltaproteobacteria bacterium]